LTIYPKTNLFYENDLVQEYWNLRENVFINVTDLQASLTLYNQTDFYKNNVPKHSLFFISQHVSGGHVTVTGGD
jgi:hypothetical protein